MSRGGRLGAFARPHFSKDGQTSEYQHATIQMDERPTCPFSADDGNTAERRLEAAAGEINLRRRLQLWDGIDGSDGEGIIRDPTAARGDPSGDWLIRAKYLNLGLTPSPWTMAYQIDRLPRSGCERAHPESAARSTLLVV